MYLFYARPGCPVCVFPVYLLLQWCMGRAQTLISALKKDLAAWLGVGMGFGGLGGLGVICAFHTKYSIFFSFGRKERG